MKTCTSLLVLFWLSVALGSLNAQESKGAANRAEDGLTVEEVHLLASRVPSLKEDMTQAEVYDALGRDLLGKALLMTGHGPSSAYSRTYHLRKGYVLHLSFDVDRDRFQGAKMAGEEWEREQREKPDRTA
jgi:hypothetical protein